MELELNPKIFREAQKYISDNPILALELEDLGVLSSFSNDFYLHMARKGFSPIIVMEEINNRLDKESAYQSSAKFLVKSLI